MFKIVAITFLFAATAVAEDLTLVQDGKPIYSILVAQDEGPAAQRGAKELQTFIEQMSGAKLEIVSDTRHPPKKSIILGRVAKIEKATTLGDDGFIIDAMGTQLLIAGGKRGAMYGCYELLEKLGVRWFTPKVTRVPKQATVTLTISDEEQIPAFEYREPYFTEAWDKDWAARNRIIGHFLPLDASTGGNIRYADFVHTFDHLIPPALYKDHPEYFPLIEGKRKNGYVQRCLTNPDVLKLAIEGVKKAFKDHPDATITSVSQNDTSQWCQCDNCKKLTEQYGAHSGLYIWFVNQVAEAIEKEMPDKLIDTLAYQFTEAPPKGIAPRKNVRVRLCPISVCQSHSYDKDYFNASKEFVANLAAWAKITDTLYIWHYNTNFAHYLAPFPDFKQLPENVKLYKRSGVKGVFFEGAYGPGGGGSDAELRSWIMAKMLWNPDVDADALVTEWMTGVYGKAEPPMRKWFDLLHARAANPDYHMTCYFKPDEKLFPGEVLAEGDKLFDEAAQLASGDAIASEYVAKSRLWLRYAQIATHKPSEDEVKQFAAEVRKFGIGNINEGQSVDAWEKAQLDKPKPAK